MEQIKIRLMGDRDYLLIPIDRITIVNSRNRNKVRFKENVRSIDKIGLLIPIMVNKRKFSQTDKYELVCGEGRLLSYKELGKTEIAADVVDIDEGMAQLMTLGENIARARPASMDFARAIKEMFDKHGTTLDQLSIITGKTPEYIRWYLRLMEQGEERLIKGVEDGVFSINFALNVAQSSDRSVQHILMDAFDNGIVNTSNLGRVRRIIEDRLQKGRALTGRRAETPYSVDKLKGDIQQITRQKESFVYEANQKENRLVRTLLALRTLNGDEQFVNLLKTEGLTEQPQLKESYAV